MDHFRYFASVIRAESGSITDLDSNTVSMEIHEPLGVVAQIIPWNFPLLMAAWKIAPAIAAGNCVILKAAEQTPVSIMVMMELIQDVVPKGVINIINGFGPEAGKPLATHPNIKKVGFTGETYQPGKDYYWQVCGSWKIFISWVNPWKIGWVKFSKLFFWKVLWQKMMSFWIKL